MRHGRGRGKVLRIVFVLISEVHDETISHSLLHQAYFPISKLSLVEHISSELRLNVVNDGIQV